MKNPLVLSKSYFAEILVAFRWTAMVLVILLILLCAMIFSYPALASAILVVVFPISMIAACLVEVQGVVKQNQQLKAEAEMNARALRASEVRFHGLLETMKDVFWSFDLTGKQENFVSLSASKRYHLPLSDLAKSPFFWYKNLQEDSAEIEIKVSESLARTGEAEYTYRVVDAENVERWYYNRERLVNDSHGMPVRREGTSIDITYIKQTEKIIERQEFQLEAILKNLDMAVTIVDSAANVMFFNAFAADLSWQVSGKLQIGMWLPDFFSDAKKKDEIAEQIHRVLLQRETINHTIECRFRNDSDHWFLVNYVPVMNALGELTQICILSREITSEKIANDKLRVERNLLRTLINNIPDYIYVKNRELRHVINNAAVVKMIGGTREDTLGQSVQNCFPPSYADRFEADDKKVIATGLPLIVEEDQLVDGNGRQLWIHTTKVPLKDESGNVTGLVGISRDITEVVAYRKNLEELVNTRTAELNKALAKEKELVDAKNKFVSIASHEFRTPLSTIQMAAGFVKHFHSRMKPEKMICKMEGIESQVKHMTSFLNDILAIDRVESGKVKISKAQVDLSDFFDHMIEDIQDRTGYTHKIEKNFPDTACAIQTDERFVKNIFGNLIHNAIKFSPANRCITINMFNEGAHIYVEVVDRGVGIPQHEISQIFDSFHRASNAKDIEGTGLGLAIVRKAVDLLGGEITVSSELGAGSVFKVKLPAS